MFKGLTTALQDRLCSNSQRKSYALNQLDVKLETYLRKRGGFFIEAGANDGIRQSNTFYFEKYLGWRGLLIEAIPALAQKCRQNRPRCAVENCALVSEDYIGRTIEVHYRDLMSMVKGGMADPVDEARHLELGKGFMKMGDTPQALSVPAKTLNRVLAEHRVGNIDLLSLDVEGYEVEVLRGIDFKRHRPGHLLVEVRDIRAIERVILPWYRQISILNQNEDYADILYELIKQ